MAAVKNAWSKIRSKMLSKNECRAIVVGLDGSGKTTIVYRLKHGKVENSNIIPTIGFNCECVEYKKMVFSMWDLGGSQDARSFWRMYYKDTQAIIFVVDSSDLERMVSSATSSSATLRACTDRTEMCARRTRPARSCTA